MRGGRRRARWRRAWRLMILLAWALVCGAGCGSRYEDAERLARSGQEAAARGERAAAIQALREALTAYPEHVEARLLLGQMLGEEAATREEALKHLRIARQNEPQSSAPMLTMAEVELRHAQALRAEGTQPGQARSSEAIDARQRAQLGFEAAAAYARQALALDPYEVRAHEVVFESARGRGEVVEEAAALSSWLRSDPSRPEPFEALGELYLELGQSGAARQVSEAGLSNHPQDVGLLAVLGMALWMGGEDEGALTRFEAAIVQLEADGGRELRGVMARLGRGLVLHDRGRAQLAAAEDSAQLAQARQVLLDAQAALDAYLRASIDVPGEEARVALARLARERAGEEAAWARARQEALDAP